MRWLVIVAVLAAQPSFAQDHFGFVRAWGAQGGSRTQFAGVWSIAVSRSGFVYVGDGDHIRKFDLDGRLAGYIHLQDGGEVRGLSVSPDNRIYWSGLDGYDRGVFWCDSTLTAVHGSGAACARACFDDRTPYLGVMGLDARTAAGLLVLEGRFRQICGPVQVCNIPGRTESIAVDGMGSMFVTIWTNPDGGGAVYKYAANGSLMGSWTGSEEAGAFDRADGIALDAFGRVYVVDSRNHRIQMFTNNGYFMTAWGSYGNAPGQFSSPTAIAIDTQGNVYVADSGNSRVQKFSAYVAVQTKSWTDVRKTYR